MDVNSNNDKIAVIGMACRFPGAKNLNEYWKNLIEGKETIKQFTDEELSKFEINYNELKKNPDYIKARGILDNIDKFDTDFFEMTPREAERTDPQHRVWFEIAWEAFEDAGCDPFNYPGAIGVFAGGYLNTYLLNNILRNPILYENYIRLRTTESFQIMTGNDAAYIPTKTAYKFNLRGPAINIQTACSTSLVAIAQACQSLFSFESDICLAGGICILTPQESGYIYQEGAIPSNDGHCRPFDVQGKGTVFSNGAGVVVLKRLEDAVRDRDHIYALVSGWALNNDGNNKVGYTAPSIDGQIEVILMAQSFADVSPEDIGYIEAHGTGTPLGDPIELEALTRAFTRKTEKKQFCGIGSVKSNIGHTDAAAGVASFIKSCLSAYYKIIPATLNFTVPNPYIDFKKSPFFVQNMLEKWDKDKPLVIGVSSFGIGGTNAHVILEEPPFVERLSEKNISWPRLLPLSAKSENALNERKQDLLNYIENESNAKLDDVAYTLQTGRNHMQYRSYCVTRNFDEIKSGNTNFSKTTICDHLSEIAFMFPGQGAQYVGMAQTLYSSNNQFKQTLDKCFGILKSEAGFDLKEILFSIKEIESAEKKLARTDITQPALFIVEFALAQIYESLGIKPKYLLGHSIGEYVAACLSGVFDLESALKIVVKRGQLMQSMPEGSMMAVRCNKEKLAAIQNSKYEIAAENTDTMCTISFRTEDYESIKNLLDNNYIGYIPLNTSHSFHSSSFDPILEEFSNYVNQFKMNVPGIPFISCLTGEFITSEQATSGSYWSNQLRNAVLFKKGVSTILQQEEVLFLEVGPNTHLSSITRQNVNNKKAVVFSLGKKDNIDDQYKIIKSLGDIWTIGISLRFDILNQNNQAQKICLPTYPFQRKRYWIEYHPDLIFQDLEVSPKITTTEQSVKQQIQPQKVELIDEIKELFCELSGLDIESIKEDMSYDSFGVDSLFLAQFASNLEKKYKVKVEFRLLSADYSTLKKLAVFLEEKSPETVRQIAVQKRNELFRINNLVKFKSTGNKPPLIIVHGDNANFFLPEFIDENQPFFGFIHPGSDGEKIRFKSVSEMAKAYLDQLFVYQPEGPYYLCGFSFGGVLAFEMAIQLQKMSHKVPFLVLIDCLSPLAHEPIKWQTNIFKIIRKNILGPFKRKLICIAKQFICESFIVVNVPVPINRRNFYILNKYRILTSKYSPERFEDEMLLIRVSENTSSFEYLGWENLAEKIKLVTVEADHTTIVDKKENVKIVYDVIEKYLDHVNKL